MRWAVVNGGSEAGALSGIPFETLLIVSSTLVGRGKPPRSMLAVMFRLVRKYALARYAAWMMVMIARRAERMEKRMLIVTSGGSFRDVKLCDGGDEFSAGARGSEGTGKAETVRKCMTSST